MTKQTLKIVMHPEISKWRNESYDQKLYDSLEKDGQLQNLVARRLPDGSLQLLSGGRRYAALKAMGVKPENMDIKILENVSEVDAVLYALTENKARKDLSAIEEGRAFATLKKLNMPVDEIAMRNHVSESYVKNRLMLLKLPPSIQEIVEHGKVDFSYANAILRLEKFGERVQEKLVQKIIEGKSNKYSYGGVVHSVEEADAFVEQVEAATRYMEDLVNKYGPCPKCGSRQVREEQYGDKNKLECLKCKHEWHKITKDPWKLVELKKDAQAIGLKIEVADGKAKITGEDVTDVMKRIEQEQKNSKRQISQVIRSFDTIDKILAPLIQPGNLNVVRVEGERIEIRTIQDCRMAFTARRHNYDTGEKSIIRPLGNYFNEDKAENRERITKYLETLKPT